MSIMKRQPGSYGIKAMEYTLLGMYVMGLTMIVMVIEVESHRVISSSAMIDSSEEFRTLQFPGSSERRALRQMDAEYEGIPIDLPDNYRRRLDRENEVQASQTSTADTTTETTAASPPLDRRYRRVYRAEEAAEAEPYLAAVLIHGALGCSGAVLARDTVLLAARCLQLQYDNRLFREYTKLVSVRVGSVNASSGGALYRAAQILFHPNYKPHTLEFNAALVKTQRNMSLGGAAGAAVVQYSRAPVTDGHVLFLGWGAVLGSGDVASQVLLQKLDLPVYDLADCQDIYGRDLVTRNNFCAGYITLNKNICNHEAGGAALRGGVLAGLLSFSARRCDLADRPAVFTAAAALAPWLHAAIIPKRLAYDK